MTAVITTCATLSSVLTLQLLWNTLAKRQPSCAGVVLLQGLLRAFQKGCEGLYWLPAHNIQTHLCSEAPAAAAGC